MTIKSDDRWIMTLGIYLFLLAILIVPPLVFQPEPQEPIRIKNVLIEESLRKSKEYRDSLITVSKEKLNDIKISQTKLFE